MRDQDVPAVAAVGVAPHPGLLTADATGLRLSALTPETAALTVLRHGPTTVTAGALDRTVRTISMGLAAAGVVPGDRVAAVPRNRIELVLRLRIGSGSRPVTDYAEWLAAHAPPGAHRRAVDGVVPQVYTSGASGVPKGVQLTAVNIGAEVELVGRAWEFGRDAVSLPAAPLSRIGALSGALVGLRTGATTLPSLRHIAYGAAPIAPAEQRRAARRLGCDLHQLYGLTETTGGITQLGTGTVDAPEALSVGPPCPVVLTEELPRNATGKVLKRSPRRDLAARQEGMAR
ncbi:AMP-binding protein [Streptomyces rapamycinicus]|uniref:AMP-dependent synthetase/ligase domain-containing protein n=2 Tax=Streptomyces rapamycinicus TaxID=1226757 RepID=A0A0A0N5U9_STRRN|nr:AMP-binding protein [Streptomyces rapamycinicus]AGP51754.1 hypothetical protein M271_00575 [Streptomyces rapamycinicus NRRL 5491]MBB4779165.1 long-subunit acyl-CoA synthetase (AMP-forming) [Streptomyces rapamycinicus]RLV76167.1 hypothetical protein D3C57_143115 [Streptomyces rapamycinicus NRRL 5491]UTP27980.1 AMP-binding protein [Streptomyces rapamycinicus NRRL 5491]